MEDKKFTVDDAVDLFGDDEQDDEQEEETEEDPDPNPDPDPVELKMKLLDSAKKEDPEPDGMIVEIGEKALEIVGKCEGIYKLTLQGRLETEFPLVNKRTIRKAVNSLKDHPEIKWPHGMLLQKV